MFSRPMLLVAILIASVLVPYVLLDRSLSQTAQAQFNRLLGKPEAAAGENPLADLQLPWGAGENGTTANPPSASPLDRLPVSLRLMVYAQVLALLLSIPLGIVAAYRAGSKVDGTVTTGSFAVLAIPSFVLGVLLVYVFSIELGWLPAIQRDVGFFDDPAEHVRQYLLPTVTLTAGLVAVT